MVLKRIALALFLCALMPLSANAADKLMMATTTSTQDTGLLEYLQPYFKKDTGNSICANGHGAGRKTGEKPFPVFWRGIGQFQVAYPGFQKRAIGQGKPEQALHRILAEGAKLAGKIIRKIGGTGMAGNEDHAGINEGPERLPGGRVRAYELIHWAEAGQWQAGEGVQPHKGAFQAGLNVCYNGHEGIAAHTVAGLLFAQGLAAGLQAAKLQKGRELARSAQAQVFPDKVERHVQAKQLKPARVAKCPWAAPCAVKAGVFGKRVKRAPYKAGVKTIEIGIPGFWQRQYSPEAPDSARGKKNSPGIVAGNFKQAAFQIKLAIWRDGQSFSKAQATVADEQKNKMRPGPRNAAQWRGRGRGPDCPGLCECFKLA